MSISNNIEKNIEVKIIRTKTIKEEISVNTIEQKIFNDPDEKKLLRKLDLHLLPTLAVLYLLCFLDRVSIGQAKLNNLTESLKLTSTQYNACLSVFFVTYVAFEIPSNLILKKIRPSRWIPIIMIAWGTIMTLMGLVNSYGGLLACRIFLGAAEAGLFPGK
jgi:sugar phosphate permease